jgi:LysM repeat protein
MTRGRLVTGMGLLLVGCVPPGASRLPETKTATVPRIEPLMDGLIDETPIWEARPVTANATTINQTLYVVKPGDGLRAIGELTGAGSETIARINGLSPPYLLKPGQLLRIPAGRYHRVGTGETGIAIARAYGIPWSAIVTANNLAEPFVLRVGQRLLLPGESMPSTEARAAAFRVNIDDIETGSAPAQASISDALPSNFGRSRQPRHRNRCPRWKRHSRCRRWHSGFCRQWRIGRLWRVDPSPPRRWLDQRLWTRRTSQCCTRPAGPGRTSHRHRQ